MTARYEFWAALTMLMALACGYALGRLEHPPRASFLDTATVLKPPSTTAWEAQREQS